MRAGVDSRQVEVVDIVACDDVGIGLSNQPCETSHNLLLCANEGVLLSPVTLLDHRSAAEYGLLDD